MKEWTLGMRWLFNITGWSKVVELIWCLEPMNIILVLVGWCCNLFLESQSPILLRSWLRFSVNSIKLLELQQIWVSWMQFDWAVRLFNKTKVANYFFDPTFHTFAEDCVVKQQGKVCLISVPFFLYHRRRLVLVVMVWEYHSVRRQFWQRTKPCLFKLTEVKQIAFRKHIFLGLM